ncbi:Small subunit (SSU) processome component [Taxawa tesnikishii (nom. ined.)]|nr:Small subunit (SSU) processome component [Dothideales sp. JES 119]
MNDHKPEAKPIEISSDESSEYEESDDEDAPNGENSALANGTDHDEASDENEMDAEAGAEDVAMVDGDEQALASHPDAIDVQAAFTDRSADAQALVPISGDKVLAAPSATSLGTVLTQALRTNDKELLESCFQMTDVASIRSTIQRLQSPLVEALLKRLTERLHKRPGRAGNLMVWVQWSLVAHGGYLATRPDVMKKLKSLSQVIRERANGLQPLMALKGKLDMLSAQIELRKSIQESRAGPYDTDEDEPGVIYVEGQNYESTDEEADEDIVAAPSKHKSGKRGTKDLVPEVEESSDDEDDDIPMANGVSAHTNDDTSEGEEEEAEEGMFDDEAEETSDDEGEDTSEADDTDEDEEAEEETSASEDDEGPCAKQSKPVSRSSLGRRR